MTGFGVFLSKHTWMTPIVSGATTAVVAGVIALFTIKKQRQTARENNSLSFERDYKRCEYVRSAWDVLFHRVFKNRSSFAVERYAESRFSKSEGNKAIKDILNEWERAANAINHRLYDDRFLYKAFGSTVLFLRKGFYPYIAARRSDNASYYRQFMSMSLRWMIMRSKEKEYKNSKHEPSPNKVCVCKDCIAEAIAQNGTIK